MSDKERQSFLASGELISITEAAANTPYSAEYLSLRARTGHLKALKIARNWLTTREAVLSYMTEQEAKHWRQARDEQHGMHNMRMQRGVTV
jgi:hypothetical protein